MAKSKKTDTSESRDIMATLVKWLWILLILGLIAVAAIFMLVSYTKMPDTEELENPDYEYATVIYSADEQELGKYFSKNREGLNYEDLNPYLVNGLIATEDERFNEHSGIDVRSTLRAFMYMGGKGGASTITQQLAKQFFTKRSRSFIKRIWQKLKEWVICTQFEKRYTKEEILAMYLNKFDFIYSSAGVSAAAKTYFGKNQKDLTVDEAAMLVGMLKNPYVYNPKKNPENALTRRNVVMKQMVRNNYLTKTEYEEIKEKPLDMANFNRSNHFTGPAPYFLQTLKLNIKDILKDDKYKKNDGTSYNLDEDGLRIYTTIDMRFQKHAEAAMLEEMKKIQKNFREEWRGKDPWVNSDKAQNQNRKDFLNSAVRSSERYVNMKNRVLAPVIQKIKEKFPDSRMWDTDIKRILRAEKDNKYLDKQVKNEIVRKKQATAYKKVLSDPLWKEFKRERSTLDKKAAKIFNAKTKMNIFAYNEKGEESVVMSPMDSIKYHQSLMQLGSVSIDPSTGHIKTWVGGIGNKYFKLDHVRTNRQVGSTFKPFVYATAIAQAGYSPCHKIHDIRHEIPAGDPNFGLLETWAPDNSDGTFTETWWTLKDGLKRSKNSISVGLLKEMGSVEPIRDLADNMGISKRKIPKVPSIILGSSQLNVLEMTSAYSTFANAGIHNSPTFITKIEDSEGKVIYTSIPEQKRILSEKYNEAMVNLLQYASSAVTHLLKYGEWGGKTGTTNDHVDGWFMGITPNLVVGTWVGGDVNYIRFQSLRFGSGGKMARPYFLNFMNRLENDPSINLNQNATFKVPEGDRIVTDCSQYERPISSKQEADEKRSIKELLEEHEDEFGGE